MSLNNSLLPKESFPIYGTLTHRRSSIKPPWGIFNFRVYRRTYFKNQILTSISALCHATEMLGTGNIFNTIHWYRKVVEIIKNKCHQNQQLSTGISTSDFSRDEPVIFALNEYIFIGTRLFSLWSSLHSTLCLCWIFGEGSTLYVFDKGEKPEASYTFLLLGSNIFLVLFYMKSCHRKVVFAFNCTKMKIGRVSVKHIVCS